VFHIGRRGSIVLTLALSVDPFAQLAVTWGDDSHVAREPVVHQLPLPVTLLPGALIHLSRHAGVSEAGQRFVFWKVVKVNSCDNLTRFG